MGTTDVCAGVKTLLLLIGWCLLLVACWLLAPVVCLLLLPLRLLATIVHAVFALLRAILMLPARLLGGQR